MTMNTVNKINNQSTLTKQQRADFTAAFNLGYDDGYLMGVTDARFEPYDEHHMFTPKNQIEIFDDDIRNTPIKKAGYIEGVMAGERAGYND